MAINSLKILESHASSCVLPSTYTFAYISLLALVLRRPVAARRPPRLGMNAAPAQAEFSMPNRSLLIGNEK